MQGGVEQRKLGLLSRLMEVLEIDVERPLDRGLDPKFSRGGAGSTCEPWPLESQPAGLGFPHRAGRYHVWMGSDPYRARVTPTSCMNPVQ